MDEKYYMNQSTGEITYDHTEACEWFRQHDNVTIYYRGEVFMTWEW